MILQYRICSAIALSMLYCSVACGNSVLLLEDRKLSVSDLRASVNAAEYSVKIKMAKVKECVLSKEMTLNEAAERSVQFGESCTNIAEKILFYKGAIVLLVRAGDYVRAETVYDSMTNSVNGLPPMVCAKILNRALEEYCEAGTERLSMIIDKNLAQDELNHVNEQLKEDPNNVLLRRKAGEKYVILRDWGSALANFALSGGDYARMAREELEIEHPDYRGLGDFWWLESNNIADMLHEGYRIHARDLYQMAEKERHVDRPR